MKITRNQVPWSKWWELLVRNTSESDRFTGCGHRSEKKSAVDFAKARVRVNEWRDNTHTHVVIARFFGDTEALFFSTEHPDGTPVEWEE